MPFLGLRPERVPESSTEVAGIGAAFRDAIKRVLPAEVRGNDRFTAHLEYEVIGGRGPMRVLRFAKLSGETPPLTGEPILFVYSLINRYYILDFMPKRSVIEYFIEQGRPCYVIDWGIPGRADRHKTWADYALRYIDYAAKLLHLREGMGEHFRPADFSWDRVARLPAQCINLLGYCVGGVLSLTYAALHPERVKTLTLMATPVDFYDEGLLSQWTRSERFDVDQIVNTFGHVPTWLLEGGFRMMTPMTHFTKWRDLWEGRRREGFIEMWRRMEQWSSDNVPFPAEVYRQYIRDTYQTNAFFKGEMIVEGQIVDLSRVQCPVLSLIATRDHIVPPESALALQTLLTQEQLTILECETGHLGLSTSGKARSVFWPKIQNWLDEHASTAEDLIQSDTHSGATE